MKKAASGGAKRYYKRKAVFVLLVRYVTLAAETSSKPFDLKTTVFLPHYDKKSFVFRHASEISNDPLQSFFK